MTTEWKRWGAPVLLTAIGLAGCSPADAGPRVERETLPNGGTRLHYPSLASSTPSTARVDLRIGQLEGEGAAVFGQVRDLEVDAGGNVYVLDAQASEVRVFGPDGSHLRTLGGRGQGPGEISEANGIALSGDTLLWVQDHGQWRYIGLDPETGDEITRVPMHVLSYGYTWAGGTDREGRIWKSASHSDEERSYPPETGMNEYSFRAYMKWLDPATEASDSIFLGTQSGRSYISAIGGGYRYSGIPFEGRPQTAIDPFGGFWLTDSRPYRVVHVDLEGDTTLVIEADVPGPPVTQEELRQRRDAAEERSEGDLRIAVELEGFMPETKAPIAALHTDDQGRLWVERTVESIGGAPLFDVFSRSGDFLGTVVPDFRKTPSIAPAISADGFHALEQNELDVPVVVRAAIPPLGGESAPDNF